MLCGSHSISSTTRYCRRTPPRGYCFRRFVNASPSFCRLLTTTDGHQLVRDIAAIRAVLLLCHPDGHEVADCRLHQDDCRGGVAFCQQHDSARHPGVILIIQAGSPAFNNIAGTDSTSPFRRYHAGATGCVRRSDSPRRPASVVFTMSICGGVAGLSPGTNRSETPAADQRAGRWRLTELCHQY